VPVKLDLSHSNDGGRGSSANNMVSARPLHEAENSAGHRTSIVSFRTRGWKGRDEWMNELKRKQKEDKKMKVEKIAFADKFFISNFFVVSDWNT